MGAITQVLVQFVFRLSCGLAISMGVTSSRLVTSGYFRVHLWVLMGANTFAALAAYSARTQLDTPLLTWKWQFGFAVALALASYLAAVIWLYERKQAGTAALALIGIVALAAALTATPWPTESSGLATVLGVCDVVTGALLLGATMAAMFLGHWYLNTPSMELVPLQRLVILMAVAVVARALLAMTGLVLHWQASDPLQMTFWLFVTFRWLAGILGPLILSRMVWITLKIPNTQSATGLLYAGVILVFLGELVSQLLSGDALFPV